MKQGKIFREYCTSALRFRAHPKTLPPEEAAGSQAPISFVEKGGGLDMEKTHKKWGIKSIA